MRSDYNIFRWYRSSWGQYTQPDPLEFEGGLNLYAYVGGNPVNAIDSLGLAKNIGDMDCCELASEIKKVRNELWKLKKHQLDPDKLKAPSAYKMLENYVGHQLSWWYNQEIEIGGRVCGRR